MTLPALPDTAALSSWIDAHLRGYGRTWGEAYAASGTVLVARHGAPLFERSYGFADRAARTPPDGDTRFRIASVTKQMTAVAVLQLVEAGRLALDDPFRRFVPEYPAEGGDGISIRDLLAHTSGIPNYTEAIDTVSWSTVRRTSAELLARAWRTPPHFAPGAAFRYSNTNYYLLAMIVERLSGLSFDGYFRARVFGPAGMARSSASEGDFDGEAVGYKHGLDDALVLADPIDLGIPFGAGGVRSTAYDLLRWERALYEGTTMLTHASRATMLTPVKEKYGLGIACDVLEGHPVYVHHGGINGFRSTLWRIDDLALDVIVLFNTEGIAADVVGSNIVKMILHGAPVAPRAERGEVALDGATLDAVQGQYTATTAGRATLEKAFPRELAELTSRLSLRVHGASLLFDVHMGDPVPLSLGEDGALFTKRNGVVLTLERDGGVRARGVTVTQNEVFVVEYAR